MATAFEDVCTGVSLDNGIPRCRGQPGSAVRRGSRAQVTETETSGGEDKDRDYGWAVVKERHPHTKTGNQHSRGDLS